MSVNLYAANTKNKYYEVRNNCIIYYYPFNNLICCVCLPQKKLNNKD